MAGDAVAMAAGFYREVMLLDGVGSLLISRPVLASGIARVLYPTWVRTGFSLDF